MNELQTHIRGKAITSIIANKEIIQDGIRAKYKFRILEILKEDANGLDKGLSSDCMAEKIGCKPGSVCAPIKHLRDEGFIVIIARELRPNFEKSRHIYKLAKD